MNKEEKKVLKKTVNLLMAHGFLKAGKNVDDYVAFEEVWEEKSHEEIREGVKNYFAEDQFSEETKILQSKFIECGDSLIKGKGRLYGAARTTYVMAARLHHNLISLDMLIC